MHISYYRKFRIDWKFIKLTYYIGALIYCPEKVERRLKYVSLLRCVDHISHGDQCGFCKLLVDLAVCLNRSRRPTK